MIDAEPRSDGRCEPCEFLGIDTEATHDAGMDDTPVCQTHFEHDDLWAFTPEQIARIVAAGFVA